MSTLWGDCKEPFRKVDYSCKSLQLSLSLSHTFLLFFRHRHSSHPSPLPSPFSVTPYSQFFSLNVLHLCTLFSLPPSLFLPFLFSRTSLPSSPSLHLFTQFSFLFLLSLFSHAHFGLSSLVLLPSRFSLLLSFSLGSISFLSYILLFPSAALFFTPL